MKEVLHWDDEHFAISQEAFHALKVKREGNSGSGPGGPTP